MKQLTLLILLFSSSAFAASPSEFAPQRVPTVLHRSYSPSGFDSNDAIQFVVEGAFPSSCYRPADTMVQVDQRNQRIFVGPWAYQYDGPCLDVLVPFHKVIDVGVLPAGNYQVIQAYNGKRLGDFPVKTAVVNAADDFDYAPVSQAYVERKNGISSVVITGAFTTSCLAISNVKVSLERNVIVVQPIVRAGRVCPPGHYPFQTVTPLSGIRAGRYLLHVRSMNGQAVNTLIDVE